MDMNDEANVLMLAVPLFSLELLRKPSPVSMDDMRLTF